MADGIEAVEVVRNGIPIRPPRSPLVSPPTVAFAGRLVREKGADVLMRAFAKVVAQLPKARLLVAGEGPEEACLARLIVDLGLSASVSMLGYLPRQEMEHRFDAAWVQAVPSRWMEPFGNVALEAMMRGTAVVASDAGGFAEIVQNGETGLLVPPGDADALAQGLVRLLRDRELAERMGSTGRRFALTHFSDAMLVDGFIRLYQALCQRSVHAGGH